MKFKDLNVGDRFTFVGTPSGSPQGPWVKQSARKYAPADRPGLLHEIRIGSISCEVLSENQTGLRYVNVTTIDCTGSASSTQILGNKIEDAYEYLNRKVDEGRGPNTAQPVIAAFIFDSMTKELQVFDVISIAGLVKIERRGK